jgi:hypothetical protein
LQYSHEIRLPLFSGSRRALQKLKGNSSESMHVDESASNDTCLVFGAITEKSEEKPRVLLDSSADGGTRTSLRQQAIHAR